MIYRRTHQDSWLAFITTLRARVNWTPRKQRARPSCRHILYRPCIAFLYPDRCADGSVPSAHMRTMTSSFEYQHRIVEETSKTHQLELLLSRSRLRQWLRSAPDYLSAFFGYPFPSILRRSQNAQLHMWLAGEDYQSSLPITPAPTKS